MQIKTNTEVGATIREMKMILSFDVEQDIIGSINVYYDERDDDGDRTLKVITPNEDGPAKGFQGTQGTAEYSWGEVLQDALTAAIELVEEDHNIKVSSEVGEQIENAILDTLNEKGFDECGFAKV